MEKQQFEYVMETYKLRYTSMVDHFTRYRVRFNLMMTLNAALIGYAYVSYVEVGKCVPLFLSVFGFVLAVVWFILSCQDRYCIFGYRHQILEIEDFFENELDLGDVIPKSRPFYPKETSIFLWRLRIFSLGKIPCWISLFVSLLWGLAIIVFLTSSPHGNGVWS